MNLDDRLAPKRDHVVVCEYTRDARVLLDELDELDISYVLLTGDESRAKSLSDAGYDAIHGSPQDASALERAGIGTARAVLTDAGDANGNTILTVRSLRQDVEILALTDDSDQRTVLRETGADSVLLPFRVLGTRRGEKAVSAFSRDLTDSIELGADIEVLEIPVHRDSELIDTRIRESRVRERTGATIVGAWIDGELQLPPDPDAVIRPNTVLLVTGGRESLTELSEYTRPPRSGGRHGRIVVAGLGEVGRAAQSIVEDAGVDTVTIDRDPGEGVDVVGDAGDKATLYEAGIEDAGAIIVGLPDDSAGLLATVQARSLNPDVEILVRLSDVNATSKALSAGADYVLSVSRVSARLVARELRGEDVLAPASQTRFMRASAATFAGVTVAESGIYERTGCRIIAIEDDTGLSATIDPQRRLSGDERLVIVGTDSSVKTFRRTFDVAVTDADT